MQSVIRSVTKIQIALGVFGLDIVGDIRDIGADFANWEWSVSHVGQTLLDIASLLPLLEVLKYGDEAGVLLKRGWKYVDDMFEKVGEEVGSLRKVEKVGEGSKVVDKGSKVLHDGGRELVELIS